MFFSIKSRHNFRKWIYLSHLERLVWDGLFFHLTWGIWMIKAVVVICLTYANMPNVPLQYGSPTWDRAQMQTLQRYVLHSPCTSGFVPIYSYSKLWFSWEIDHQAILGYPIFRHTHLFWSYFLPPSFPNLFSSSLFFSFHVFFYFLPLLSPNVLSNFSPYVLPFSSRHYFIPSCS